MSESVGICLLLACNTSSSGVRAVGPWVSLVSPAESHCRPTAPQSSRAETASRTDALPGSLVWSLPRPGGILGAVLRGG
eukprot:4431225-Prymnesium_polylepis.1